MTFEELKTAANAMGYTLTKKREYVPHLKCSCGGHGRAWYSTKGKGMIIICSECERQAEYCKTETLAWKAWNKMQSEVDYD